MKVSGIYQGLVQRPVEAQDTKLRPRFNRCTNNGAAHSRRIDHEEFWSRRPFQDFAEARVGLRAWDTT